MKLLLLSLLLFHISEGKPRPDQNKHFITVKLNDEDPKVFLETLIGNTGLEISEQSINGKEVTFAVADGKNSFVEPSVLAKEIQVIAPGATIDIPLQQEATPQDNDSEDNTSKKFYEKYWFVGLAAVIVGIVIFLLVASPLCWCMLQRKKKKTPGNAETQQLDIHDIKRYDTISRDGSIQSRRKGAPNTLTLTTLSAQPSMESSDSDSSPPGVKEALQTRTNPLTPLQLRQRLDNPALLYAEFSSLPTNEETRLFKKSSLKNRYKGVLPNLHSRVKLPGPNDYINANFIRGFQGRAAVYIATQGPLKNTVDDFWRMIWEQKVSTIVMITKLQEKGRNKCVIYWPDKMGNYSGLTVTVRNSSQYEGFTVTSMFISDGVEMHRLCHFWMWSWPDQGVPESSKSLLAMVECVHSVWQHGQSPLVVHCSAGLGRTGCFIAVDIGIQSLKHDRAVDVLKIIASMRLDRGGMVQTLEQYEFVHRALLRHEMVDRNRYRFRGLRKASFSHEGPAEALYGKQSGSRRMSLSATTPTLPNLSIDLTSTSLPTYITTPLLDGEVPSPDSPKPPSLLQLSKLMEKTSKRKISQLRRIPALDFSIAERKPFSPPTKYMAADDSSPELLKTPTPLTKSSFSLDLCHGPGPGLMPRSASEDTPDYGGYPGGTVAEAAAAAAAALEDVAPSRSAIHGTIPTFTFDFDTLPAGTRGLPESPLYVNPLIRQTSVDSESPKSIIINS